jgi:hypothetical protein
MFLDLSDPDPDPLVRGMDPDPDPSIIMQKSKKNLDSCYFVTLFDFLSLKNDVIVPSKSIKGTWQRGGFSGVFAEIGSA